MKGLNISCYIIFPLFLIGTLITNAQKLPPVQTEGLRIPANIKIDGKAKEWGDKFQAYNKNTEVFYTIANDDDKLYLIIQAAKPIIINKILLGGITFTVSSSGKKNDKENVAITFPTFYNNARPNINLKSKPEPTKDTVKNKMQADSFMRVVNRELGNKTKIIEIAGVKSIADSVISIYNEEGFKAIASFDQQINYTSELVIPLKYLGVCTNKPAMFHYNIRLNGPTTHNATMQLSSNGRMYLVTESNGHAYAVMAAGQYSSYAFPTDFWGTYTLAGK